MYKCNSKLSRVINYKYFIKATYIVNWLSTEDKELDIIRIIKL